MRSRQNRVACNSEQSLNLTFAWCEHFFSQRCNGILTNGFGKMPHACVPLADAKATTLTGCSTSGGTTSNRQRKHCPTWCIEIARQHVDHINKPRSGGTKGHRCCTNTAIHRRSGRPCNFMCNATNCFCTQATHFGNNFWSKACKCLL